MPLSSPLTQPIFLGNLTSNSLVGTSISQFALAVSMGLELYSLNGLLVSSVDTGTVGSGVGTGFGVAVAPTTFMASFIASFAANSVLGTMSSSLINGLSSAFSFSLQQAQIQTVSTSVGVGTGIITLIPNSASSLSSWIAGFSSAGLVGSNISQIISAISTGFDQAISTAVGSIVIAGSPSIIPSSGVGFGILL